MKIGVIGSINIDLVVKLNQFLKKGETIIGSDFQLHMGGKGANQASMIRSLVDSVVFCGAVGDDIYAEKVMGHFKKLGISHEFIKHKKGNTGLAMIQLVSGDNAIAVIPGVNNKINKEDIDDFIDSNGDLKIIVLQLEINYDAIEYIVNKCSSLGITIILNPAPAREISKAILDKIDYLIPNESEAQFLFKTDNYYEIVEEYKGKVLITLGEKGVIFWDKYENVPKIIPAHEINVVDTTGAGDSFVAGFSVGILKNKDIKDCIELGITLASLTCESMGAQGAYERIKKEIKV